MSGGHFYDDRRCFPANKEATTSRCETMETSDRSELAIAEQSDGRAYEQEEDDRRSLNLLLKKNKSKFKQEIGLRHHIKNYVPVAQLDSRRKEKSLVDIFLTTGDVSQRTR